MLLKRLDDVDLSDIETLRENKALESRFIDFKAKAIGGAEKDKREFLADVTAFANVAGGDLILGVRTKDGAADNISASTSPTPTRKPNAWSTCCATAWSLASRVWTRNGCRFLGLRA